MQYIDKDQVIDYGQIQVKNTDFENTCKIPQKNLEKMNDGILES